MNVSMSAGCHRFTLPLDQDLAHSASEACADGTLWFEHRCAMAGCWQCWWGGWRRADEFLEETHLEDVVEAGAWRKLEPVGDVADNGRDAVRAVEAWPKLTLRRDL
ncbi:hypothetical protein GQ55_8G129500 [Panicum hallii var. hallii]|uniref:Uncharacterized protein n=1 Tax=Panicum hallii var. hallii TaxID=1504633 RepID=A0A2T7CMX2_9POAL|nr:hypothetical protein GQ55_8G129500 [Panicum hallii var. hallii]